MAVPLLSSLLLLLPPLLPAKVFLVETEALSDETEENAEFFPVDTEAVSEETGETADSQNGLDYSESRCRNTRGCGNSHSLGAGYYAAKEATECGDDPKWTKRNKMMEKRQEARREEGAAPSSLPGGFWIKMKGGKLLPKGADRFCCTCVGFGKQCKYSVRDGERVKDPKICRSRQKAAQPAPWTPLPTRRPFEPGCYMACQNRKVVSYKSAQDTKVAEGALDADYPVENS